MATANVDTAAQRLRSSGAYLMPSAELNGLLGTDADAWRDFGAHWEDLVADPYAAELGVTRMRRYGHVSYRSADGSVEPVAHDAFIQPVNSNPLYIDRARHFEPLTAAFANEPVLQHLLALLGRLAGVLDEVERWSVKVTPFRVLASADGLGQPTPEGLHRDGVTLVTSLLIGRDNAVGGQNVVVDGSGRTVLTATLDEPGTLLVGDDRSTRHGVSPIRPRDPSRPARRDVLVITFAPPDRR